MKTVENMSASASLSSFSVRMRICSPCLPMLRAIPQTVSGAFCSSSTSHARCRVSFRCREAGLYRQTEKSPSAAQRSRVSITFQSVSRSDSEITQKSCPSGAPSSAAPDTAAVTPGITTISTPGYSSLSSSTGLAMP